MPKYDYTCKSCDGTADITLPIGSDVPTGEMIPCPNDPLHTMQRVWGISGFTIQ